MLTSLYSGLSGIDANGTALSVTGNNIANVNTVGFKASEVTFEDVLGATVSVGQIGAGTTVGSITAAFTQGAFESTQSATDLAINGNGFFVVSDGTTQQFTRAGHFIFDAQGNLVTPDGLVLQGWLADQTGAIATTTPPTNLSIGTPVSPPSATTSFNLAMNLDVGAAIDTDTDAEGPDVDEAEFSTSFDVFDSKGSRVTVTIEFQKVDPDEWTWTATASDGTPVEGTNTGTLQFDATGALIDPDTEPVIEFTDLGDGAAPLELTWDLLNDEDTSNGSVTSFASPSVVNSRTQDGFDAGVLQGVSVDETGVISGVFSNGQNRDLGQVALADFRSPWNLLTLGGGLYAASLESGEPAIGLANSGGRGSISAAALETSNVDLAREFVKMITAQRGFQASSRVITITDSVLDDVVNLKR